MIEMEREEIDKILKEKEKLFVEMVLNRNLWRNKCIKVQEIIKDWGNQYCYRNTECPFLEIKKIVSEAK